MKHTTADYGASGGYPYKHIRKGAVDKLGSFLTPEEEQRDAVERECADIRTYEALRTAGAAKKQAAQEGKKS